MNCVAMGERPRNTKPVSALEPAPVIVRFEAPEQVGHGWMQRWEYLAHSGINHADTPLELAELRCRFLEANLNRTHLMLENFRTLAGDALEYLRQNGMFPGFMSETADQFYALFDRFEALREG